MVERSKRQIMSMYRWSDVQDERLLCSLTSSLVFRRWWGWGDMKEEKRNALWLDCCGNF